MSVLVWGMIGSGVAALVVGLLLVRGRFAAAQGAEKLIVLGPVLEAVALAIFAAEHFFDVKDLAAVVPAWMPWHVFWACFVGVALVAAAASLMAWRCVRWSALGLAAMFLIFVATMDVPAYFGPPHDRFLWILTARETAFAGGVLVLAGSQWLRGRVLMFVGRWIVAVTCVFYGVQHFLHPRNVPGVPLEKMTPAWVPAPEILAFFVGGVLLGTGFAMMVRRWSLLTAATAGGMLVALTVVFYVPILVMEIHTPLAVEGVNYVGDTLLFGATVLLVGFCCREQGNER